MARMYKRHTYDERYHEMLMLLQGSQTKLYWNITADGGSVKCKDLIVANIRKFITDNDFHIPDYSDEELCDKLYNDLQGYSILTEPLNDEMVEGIHINGWNNVRLQLVNGRSIKTDGFNSPQHAVDIVRRLLQESKQTLDDATPVASGGIGATIRIEALKSPVAIDSAGVYCYIRKMRLEAFCEDDYLSGDFAVKKELDFLKISARRGVSILICGKRNTGKTTFLGYLLSTLPDDFEIITISTGASEINIVKKDENCNIVNNVMHLQTKESKDEMQNITQERLVESALRLNPDYIGMTEIRNTEAYAACEASQTNHPIMTTLHAGSPQMAHRRIANLYRKKSPTDFHTALEEACTAFPIVVFIHALEDNKRRILDIAECIVEDNKILYNPIWKYKIKENIATENYVRVKGEQIQLGNISDNLIEQMERNGLSQKELATIQKEE